MKHTLFSATNVPMVCLNCGVVHNYSGTYDAYPLVECPDCHSIGTSVMTQSYKPSRVCGKQTTSKYLYTTHGREHNALSLTKKENA